jgi:hypothetical protein
MQPNHTNMKNQAEMSIDELMELEYFEADIDRLNS